MSRVLLTPLQIDVFNLEVSQVYEELRLTEGAHTVDSEVVEHRWYLCNRTPLQVAANSFLSSSTKSRTPSSISRQSKRSKESSWTTTQVEEIFRRPLQIHKIRKWGLRARKTVAQILRSTSVLEAWRTCMIWRIVCNYWRTKVKKKRICVKRPSTWLSSLRALKKAWNKSLWGFNKSIKMASRVFLTSHFLTECTPFNPAKLYHLKS